MSTHGQAPPSHTRGRRTLPWGRLLWAGALLVLALLLRGFVVQPHHIVTGSMEPTLAVGDRLVVDKLSYRLHPPRAGDVVVFEPPPELVRSGDLRGHSSIKRVIALPGQEVRVHDGQVFVDGRPLHEPYVAKAPTYEWGPARVPEDMLFVLGDNRNGSSDSHVWGALPMRSVTGRAWLRFWPPARVGAL
ncbi:signal peptidase I [Pyxidicoccus fallax]|uniref:Signal peptidase I n=2 Tax=Pyxidicoccus fallax TaxID=394095 RepID=A0A848LYT0_9BACT|nr:signal peptidase I [Pyxidicoccus fallax]NMO22493.1 signal peptidase I [Pyxidicoccus fallax]NPC85428.1 signal peptidase I [Pyxidicoccus fallax]